MFNNAKKIVVNLTSELSECDDFDDHDSRSRMSIITSADELEKLKNIAVKNALTALSVNQIIKKGVDIPGDYEVSLSFDDNPLFCVISVNKRKEMA